MEIVRQRIMRHGHPVDLLWEVDENGRRRRHVQDVAARFWEKVAKSEGCWLWTAGTSPDGYGKFLMRRGDTRRAHRVAWFLTHGAWPRDDRYLLHSCDQPLCVRPDHLREGTQAENITDSVKRGRHSSLRKTNAKIDAATAGAIRKALAGGAKPKQVARWFGVSASIVHGIDEGRTWRDAP